MTGRQSAGPASGAGPRFAPIPEREEDFHAPNSPSALPAAPPRDPFERRGDVLDRGPRLGDRGHRRRAPVALLLGGPDRPVGRAGHRRRGDPVVGRGQLRAEGARSDAGRKERRPGAARAARPGSTSGGAAGGDGRFEGRRRGTHRPEMHPLRGRHHGKRVLGPSEPDGDGQGLARDGPRVRADAGRSRGAAARRARGGPEGGRRHPRPAVRGDRHREGKALQSSLGRQGHGPPRRGQPPADRRAPAPRHALARLSERRRRRRAHHRGEGGGGDEVVLRGGPPGAPRCRGARRDAGLAPALLYYWAPGLGRAGCSPSWESAP